MAKAQTRKERDLTLVHHPAPSLGRLAVHALVYRGQGQDHQMLQSRTNDNKTRMTRTRRSGNRTTDGDLVRDPNPGTDPSHDHGRALDRGLALERDTRSRPETGQYLVNNPPVAWTSNSRRTMRTARKSTVRLKRRVLETVAKRPLPVQRRVMTNQRKSKQDHPPKQRSWMRLKQHQRRLPTQ